METAFRKKLEERLQQLHAEYETVLVRTQGTYSGAIQEVERMLRELDEGEGGGDDGIIIDPRAADL